MKTLAKTILSLLRSLFGRGDGNTLLSYVPTSSPAPLQVTAPGTLTITIPVPSSTVYCNQIALGIPYGTGPGNLTDNPLDTSNISINPSSKWQVGPGKSSELGFKGNVSAFVLSTISPASNQINYPIIVTITIPAVHETASDVQILIKENSSTDGQNYTSKEGSVNINTAPYQQFYVENFIATKSDGTGSLVSEVDYNTPVTLIWEGSDNQYSIIYDENTPLSVSGNSWTTPALTHTTTFILQASQQSALGKKPKDPQTLYLYRTITVIVRNPDVVGNSLQVNGNTVLSGNVTANAAITANGTLGVTGATTLAAASMASATVNGDVNAGGNLNVSGSSALAGATVSSLQANNASIANAAINSLLSVSGSVNMIGASSSLGVGTYSNNTDGFVVGVVGYPNDASIKCSAIAYAWSGGMSAWATGGNHVFWIGDSMTSSWSWSNPNTFIMPVQKGAGYGINVWYASVNDQNPPVSFYWVPIGSSSAETLTKISDKIPEERMLKITPHKISLNSIPAEEAVTSS